VLDKEKYMQREICDVTLSVYPHRARLKNMPGHGGNRTYDLWNTSPMLCPLTQNKYNQKGHSFDVRRSRRHRPASGRLYIGR
jgi:hypothetical protein